MRILHVVHTPRLSGAEVLAKGLSIEHQSAGHAVCVTSLFPLLADFAYSRSELVAAGVICDFPESIVGRFGRLARLRHSIQSFAPDIIIAHATLAAVYVRLFPTGAPIVYVMHSGVNDFDDPKLRYTERLLSRRAAAVIGVAQKNVDDYRQHVGPHRLVKVIPNGVDTIKFGQRNDGCETSQVARPKQIVQLGRYVEEKGQLDSIRAFETVLQHEPDAKLLLCGVVEDAAYHASVVELVQRMNLAERVVLSGPAINVPTILQSASAFAMPSRMEAHSIGFLEALASGIPIVASRIAAFEFARDFAGVSLVDTTDTQIYARALLDALKMPRSIRALDGYTLRDVADQYMKLFHEVLKVNFVSPHPGEAQHPIGT